MLNNQEQLGTLLKCALPRRRFRVPKKLFTHILEEGSWTHRISISNVVLNRAQLVAIVDERIDQTLINMELSRRKHQLVKKHVFRTENVAAILCINYYAALKDCTFREAYCKAFFSSNNTDGPNTLESRVIQDTLKSVDLHKTAVKAEDQAVTALLRDLEYFEKCLQLTSTLLNEIST